MMMTKMRERCPRRSNEPCCHEFDSETRGAFGFKFLRQNSKMSLWQSNHEPPAKSSLQLDNLMSSWQVTNRMSVAELKTLVKRPDVVEVWAVSPET